ncbi:MAG: ComEA family DNA-binding protein [Betaproteobacteria bacterium]
MATIDLNQATRAEIESVRAVGVELTERLLQARSASPFHNWQDLRQRVKGVGRKALEGFAEAGFQIKGQSPPTRP